MCCESPPPETHLHRMGLHCSMNCQSDRSCLPPLSTRSPCHKHRSLCHQTKTCSLVHCRNQYPLEVHSSQLLGGRGEFREEAEVTRHNLCCIVYSSDSCALCIAPVCQLWLTYAAGFTSVPSKCSTGPHGLPKQLIALVTSVHCQGLVGRASAGVHCSVQRVRQ